MPTRQDTVIRRAPVWFVVVGCSAAGVHWGVVVLLVRHFAWLPLTANLMGWMVALGVSFMGHHRLTFKGHGVAPGVSSFRFLVISATGFAVNEASYAWLLHLSGGQRYAWLLAGVLMLTALFTYRASRHWAFLRSTQDP